MIAHVFYYRFPRIKEGLIHKEIDDLGYLLVDMMDAPFGAFLYHHGRWYLRGNSTHAAAHQRAIGHKEIPPEKVPSEIRTHLLLLT